MWASPQPWLLCSVSNYTYHTERRLEDREKESNHTHLVLLEPWKLMWVETEDQSPTGGCSSIQQESRSGNYEQFWENSPTSCQGKIFPSPLDYFWCTGIWFMCTDINLEWGIRPLSAQISKEGGFANKKRPCKNSPENCCCSYEFQEKVVKYCMQAPMSHYDNTLVDNAIWAKHSKVGF